MNLSGCFCTLTVKHRLWIMNCPRNRTSFASFVPRVSLIRVRSVLLQVWRKHRLCGFPYLWTFLFGLSYRFRVSFVLVVPHRYSPS
eukprot:25812_4